MTDHQIASDDYRRAAQDCAQAGRLDMYQVYLRLSAMYTDNVPESVEIEIDVELE